MKLNLHAKHEDKISIGCQIYLSDKFALEEIANGAGVPISILLRSMVNDLLDARSALETKIP